MERGRAQLVVRRGIAEAEPVRRSRPPGGGVLVVRLVIPPCVTFSKVSVAGVAPF